MLENIPSLNNLLKCLQQVPYLASKNIYPAPTFVLNQDEKDSYLIEQFYIDSDFYARADFYPPNLVNIANVGHFRNQRVCRIALHPLQYNPVTKELLKVEKLRLLSFLIVIGLQPLQSVHARWVEVLLLNRFTKICCSITMSRNNGGNQNQRGK